jgi:hypothetical protein
MRTIAVDTIVVVNATDVRGQAILSLVKQYIPGFPGLYYGFRPFGANDLSFPCLMVDVVDQKPRMVSTGKYHIKFLYDIWFFVIDSSPEDVVTLATSGMEALIKLFSNNALSDLGTTNSRQFKLYPGFWIDSEMMDAQISRSLLSPLPNKGKYMRAGWLRFEVQDVVIK